MKGIFSSYITFENYIGVPYIPIYHPALTESTGLYRDVRFIFLHGLQNRMYRSELLLKGTQCVCSGTPSSV